MIAKELDHQRQTHDGYPSGGAIRLLPALGVDVGATVIDEGQKARIGAVARTLALTDAG